MSRYSLLVGEMGLRCGGAATFFVVFLLDERQSGGVGGREEGREATVSAMRADLRLGAAAAAVPLGIIHEEGL